MREILDGRLTLYLQLKHFSSFNHTFPGHNGIEDLLKINKILSAVVILKHYVSVYI